MTWTPQTVAGSPTFLTSTAYNPATGQFVAAAFTGKLLTSPDGLTWTAHPSGPYNSLYSVRYANGQFIAVGSDGAIRSSPDGTTWKPNVVDISMTFEGVAYGNGRYVAVGSYLKDPNVQNSGVSFAVTSGDGMNFQAATTQDPGGTKNGLLGVCRTCESGNLQYL